MAAPDPAPPALAIRLFGPLEVRLHGAPLPQLRTRKEGQLLALFALRAGRNVDRSWLAGILWPDSPESRALANLRNSLNNLRQALGPEAACLQAPTGRQLCLAVSAAAVDVAAFDAAVARGDPPALEAAVALYNGPLLEGWVEEWAFEERQVRAQAYLSALERLAAGEQAGGKLAAAEGYLRRAIAADPLRESAQRALMQLLATGGNYNAAVFVYRELRDFLYREHNAEPDPETEELYQQLRAEQRWRAEPPPPAPALADAVREPAAGGPPGPLLPGGTVTFLFTDIEGSTRLWQDQPAAMRTALARHDALLRQSITAHEGVVFKTVGDAFCAAFTTAPDALAAALAGQRGLTAEDGNGTWAGDGRSEQPKSGAGASLPHRGADPLEVRLRVRMALHTGVAGQREGDYFGPTLNRVSRLLQTGHGGQVLLSQASYELVRDALPEDASLRDLGSHRLKDLQRPERIFQLLHPNLPADFPPPKSLDADRHNLPLELTCFIGREVEIAEVQRLLGHTRLLTLTGAGGCGKTRLALQAAADLVEGYPDGVWLVELAALSDPGLVPQAVASALRVREEPGRPLVETLTAFLEPKRLLLVLDNCEHVVEGSATLVDILLRSAPQLRLLATSREALRVGGETVWRVPSLSLPDPEQQPPAERLTQYEAVRLFIDRALLGQPEFAVTNANAPAVAEICHRLEGIPLAIELAAAQVRTVPVEEIAARLGDQLGLLTSGNRTAVPRHQTLRAALDWSYGLLSEEERALFRRISVFAAGSTLAAVEVVCTGPGVAVERVFSLLGQLVDKSLAAVEMPTMASAAASRLPNGWSGDLSSPAASGRQPAGEVRYRLLETVRQYGAEQLREAGEVSLFRGRHRVYYLALAEEAEPELEGPHQGEWLERLEREHENLRAALDWSVERGQAEGGRWLGAWAERWWVRGSLRSVLRGWAVRDELVAGLRLGGALAPFWLARGYWTEGRERLGEMLGLAGAMPRPALPRRTDRWGRRATPAAQTNTEIGPMQVFFRFGEFFFWPSYWALMGIYFFLLFGPPNLSGRLSFWVIPAVFGVMFAWVAPMVSLKLWKARRASLRARALKSAWALGPYWWRCGWRWKNKGLLPTWLLFLGCAGWLTLLSRHLAGEASAWSHESHLGARLLAHLTSLLVDLTPVAVLLSELLARLLVQARAGRLGTLAGALCTTGRVAFAQNDLPAAWSLLFESSVLYIQLGRIKENTSLRDDMARIQLRRGEAQSALYLYKLNLLHWLEHSNRQGIAAALENLGMMALHQGDSEQSRALLEESLEIRRALGDRRGISASLYGMGNLASRRGETMAARSLYTESLAIRRSLGDSAGIAECLEGLAAAAAVQGRWEESTRLMGAAEARYQELGAPLPTAAEYQNRIAAVRAALGEAAFATAWAEGRAMPLEQSIARDLEGG